MECELHRQLPFYFLTRIFPGKYQWLAHRIYCSYFTCSSNISKINYHSFCFPNQENQNFYRLLKHKEMGKQKNHTNQNDPTMLFYCLNLTMKELVMDLSPEWVLLLQYPTKKSSFWRRVSVLMLILLPKIPLSGPKNKQEAVMAMCVWKLCVVRKQQLITHGKIIGESRQLCQFTWIFQSVHVRI